MAKTVSDNDQDRPRPDRVRLDYDHAKEVFLSEYSSAMAGPEEVGEDVELLSRMCALADDSSGTFIAVVGTSLVAKSTNPNASALSRDAKADVAGSHSGRNLCMRVLAAEAPRLRIDIGVTGREPLNNQPFFGESVMVGLASKVKGDAKEAYHLLENLLHYIEELDAIEARRLLRAFIQLRAKRRRKREATSITLKDLTPLDLVDFITELLAGESEYGKRAQAVAAGLADAVYGADLVRVGKIHDSDRRFPGDVGIAKPDDDSVLERALEVRDKLVLPSDLYHFVNKCEAAGVNKAGMLAASSGQTTFETVEAEAYAAEKRMHLSVFFGWRPLIEGLIYWSGVSPGEFASSAFNAIRERLIDLEVSDGGIDHWKLLGDTFKGRSSE